MKTKSHSYPLRVCGDFFLIALALVFLANTTFAAIIPADRLYEWQGNVGVPGGIPNVTTVFTNLPSAGLSPAMIRSALGACPSNRVVVLPAGTFNFSSAIDWQGVGNGIVLRGTKINGTNATKIISSGFPGVFNFRSFFSDTYSASSNISVSTVKGDTTITFAATPSWIKVGCIYGIDELIDNVLVSENTGRESADLFRDKWGAHGRRGIAQLFKVVAKTATTITTDVPIYYTFRTSFAAQVWQPYANYDSYRTMCGIEDMDLECAAAQSDTHIINMETSYACWVKGVNFHNVAGKCHIFTAMCYRCEFRDNSFYDSFLFGAGQGYGVSLYYASCNNLIENNIFRRLHVAMQANYGSGGNVFAYNCQMEGHSDSGEEDAMNVHGCHSYMNLFEGNVTEDKAMFDCIHGSSSHNVLFRNRIAGKNVSATLNQAAITIDYWNRKCSVVGNVCGTVGYHNVRQVQAGVNGCQDTSKIVYKWGYVNAWGCDATYYDSWATLDPIFHGNYDAVGNTVAWDANIADRTIPNSLFYSSKPAYFGNRPWPAIDPFNPGAAVLTNIPAGYRYVFGVAPAAGPVNLAPTASASASVKVGAAPLTVNFSSAGSSDPEGAALTYSWNFGNGATSTSANPSYTYQTAGTFTASLTVSDGTNTATSTNITITVTQVGVNQPPIATASATVSNGPAPLAVNFSSAGSQDPEGAALSYNWNFGDGAISALANPSHTYSTSGVYVAQLKVSDGTNTSSPANVSITIANAARGLVAAYGFEEAAGTTNVLDASGNGNTGAIVGAATRTTGKFGSAMSFDGSSAFISIPDSASLDLTSGMTLEAWVYSKGNTGWKDIIFKGTDIYFLMGSTPQNQAPCVGGSFASANVYSTAAPTANTWTHLAGTYDGTTIRLYVNGVLVSSSAQTGSILTSTGALSIGGDSVYGQFWSGLIDEVRIYNRALTASEIQSDMNTAIVGANTMPTAPQGLRIIVIGP